MPKKTKNIQYYEAVGRRKQSVARVRLHLVDKSKVASIGDQKIKAGEMILNGKPLEKTLVLERERNYLLEPLKLTNNLDRFAITVISSGGGRSATLEAISLGISRAIVEADEATYRPILKKQGLLKRDDRKKEKRTVGTGGKARRLKQSPKR